MTERLSGFIEKGYRFEIKVPTNIRDEFCGQVDAYAGRRKVDTIYFRCKSMPKWNVPLQAIILSRGDDREMRRTTEEIVKRLPDVSHRHYRYKDKVLGDQFG